MEEIKNVGLFIGGRSDDYDSPVDVLVTYSVVNGDAVKKSHFELDAVDTVKTPEELFDGALVEISANEKASSNATVDKFSDVPTEALGSTVEELKGRAKKSKLVKGEESFIKAALDELKARENRSK